MKLSLPVLALVVATGLPLAACAQQSNAADNGGPSPEMRAQMQQARDNTKTAALNDLTPANRAKVQSIIDQVNNGQLTDLRAAAQQIDAALSPAETKAVLAERDKMMQTIRANMPPRPNGAGPNGGPGANGGPGPNAGPNAGPGPNGAPPNADRPRGAWGGRGGNDAGRFLLSLGVSREKMRALREAQMQQQPKPQ
jgi:Spy/CpxP family protein refolding chaperone